MPGNSVMRTAGQFGRRAQRSGQIVRSKNLHDFSVKLHSGLVLGNFDRVLDTAIEPQEEAPAAQASGDQK
jgi:hypothetical protein